MRIAVIYLLLLTIQMFSASEKVFAAAKGYSEDVIYLQLGINDLKNPVRHEEVDNETNELQKVDDALPENNGEFHDDEKFELFNKNENPNDDFKLFKDFSVDKYLDKNKDNVIDENTFLGRVFHQKIIRTDIPTYLLGNELTFHPKKGIVSDVQFFGAYQGNLSSLWQKSDYDYRYNYTLGQIGAMGKFRNTKTDFKILFNSNAQPYASYIQSMVADAYIVNSSIPHHKIIAGYSRNQIGKEGGTSSYILPFATRSQIARHFGSTRALGVRLVGDYSLLDYNLAFNSSDRFFRDWFPGAEFTGWVNVKPFGKTNGKYGNLVIGGGLNAGHNVTNYTVGSLYVGYKYKKLWTQFEYGIADGYNGYYVSTDKALGFNGTVGYKIIPQVQLIARYDFFDPNRDIPNNNRREYTAGINYFVKGQAIKFVLNYVYCQNDNSPNSHRIILATQLLL